MTASRFTPEELHAFIDGELDEDRARAVGGQIAADLALRAEVAAYRQDKEVLAAHYAPVLAKPLPEEWLQRIAESQAGRRERRAMVRVQFRRNYLRPILALAASLVLLIAGALTYRAVTPGSADMTVAQALAARDTAAGQSIAADAAQISAALGMSLKLPDLTKVGYTVAQVTVLPERGAKAVKIDYRNAADQVFTLYLRPSGGTEAFDLTKRGDLRICLWQDDVLATVMMGDMSAAEMLRVASLAYNGLYF